MSIPVDVGDLARVRSEYASGYLVSVGAGGAPKVVSVDPAVVAGAVVVTAPGKGTLANAAVRPAVTLLFPPRLADGLTLLVDGTATLDGDDLRIAPASAVLHRSAAHHDGPAAPVR